MCDRGPGVSLSVEELGLDAYYISGGRLVRLRGDLHKQSLLDNSPFWHGLWHGSATPTAGEDLRGANHAQVGRPNGPRNRLLDRLPDDELEALLLAAEVAFLQHQQLYRRYGAVAHVYLLIRCVLSIVVVMEEGTQAEAATVGNEVPQRSLCLIVNQPDHADGPLTIEL